MKLSLKQLILSVALLSVILTLVSSINAGYRVDQKTLIRNTLETNRVYAQKLAVTTENYLNMTLQTLAFSAKDIADYLNQDYAEPLLLHEADRLKEQTNTFNSVIIVSKEGEVLATSPQSLELKGKFLDSPGGQQALTERIPLISRPYTSMTGRLIVFISQPIFDGEGNYLGLIGGTIYLKEQNILNELLGEHFYQDGSYVYVVDEEGRLLYHVDNDRINDVVSQNPVVSDLMIGHSGAKRVTNSENKDMLAGYAYIPTAKWGIVSQRPTEAALLPSKDMIKEMIVKALPFLLISLIIISFISKRIAFPLQKLAGYAKSSTTNKQPEAIKDVRAWYYEAIQLEKALVNSLTYFHNKVNYFIHESTTDPLTGLVNRRTMDKEIKKWIGDDTSFSMIIVDIDKFKRVNDTYGHSIGDKVLIFLAKQMRAVARKSDVCCRFGGEEFIMLLPKTSQQEAFEVAERLRKTLETTVSPCGEIMTISAGIANFPQCTKHVVELLEIADKCLYEAKKTGRNKSIMADCQ